MSSSSGCRYPIRHQKQFSEQNKIKIVNFLYKICNTEKDKLKYAKELGDTETILDHYNKRLKSINKNIEYGFRKIG